ncbi:MAG: hypothetical protein II695_11585 [Oscillospiraceae bacterium]|nr:hypothetical protein [Oscillospiraceae bacterium]
MARKFIDEDTLREKNNAIANRQGPLKKKAAAFLYVIVLIVAVGARLIQLSTNYDFDKGRYINSNPLLNFPLLILAAGFALIAFVLITGSARDKVIKSCVLINPWRLRYDRLSKKIPQSAGYAAVAMAVLFVIDIVVYFVSLWGKNERYAKENLLNNPDVDKYAYKEYPRLAGYTVGTFFFQLLTILVILCFISMAVNIFKGEGLTHANCASLATYSIWQVVNILRVISQNDAIGLSSDRLYELASRMFAVMFFMTMARLFNGMEKKNTRFWLCFWGYTSSILAAVSVIPRYVLLLLPNGYDSRENMLVPDTADLGIIFMTVTIVGAFWTTYVYRAMPRLSSGKRRWTKAPMTRDYEEMSNIEDEVDEIVIPPEGEKIETKIH